VNGLDTLQIERIKAAWTADVDRLAGHYRFDKDQSEKAFAELKKSEAFLDIWFTDKEMVEKRWKYFDELREVQATERNPGALAFQRERAAAKRKDLDAERKLLTADLQAEAARLRDRVTALASEEQKQAAGPYAPPRTQLDLVNMLTMYGLVAMGLGLMLGLFGRLSALAGAIFLGQIYLSMPPWPGLPASPIAEGHYLIVNKNLIEMLACLALVFIPTSWWVGLDPLLFGWMYRRREASDGTAVSDSSTSTHPGRGGAAGDKPIPLSSSGHPGRK